VSGLILAVDTTHEFGSLALVHGAELLEETPLHEPDGFGHVLYGHIGRLLGRHGVDVRDIECFAAASGPGSFTGVRVGLACIKGLAHATGRLAAGVSTLEALSTFGSHPLRAVLLDARRGEVYGAVYDSERRPVAPETVAKLPVWLESLPPGDLEFIGTDLTPFAGALPGRVILTAPRAMASAVARIALDRLRAGSASDPEQVDANYVRRSDAELLWKE
jgi:tRNA threonylcarbamoyladenosine biosynthesis protein TsaB